MNYKPLPHSFGESQVEYLSLWYANEPNTPFDAPIGMILTCSLSVWEALMDYKHIDDALKLT